jgi:hypothetical protein
MYIRWSAAVLMCRSTVDEADLHDALEDAKQIPIITDGIERLAGPEYSLAALAEPTCSAPFRAKSFDVLLRTRREKIKERLLKTYSTSQVPPPAVMPTAHHHSSNSSVQGTTVSSSKSSSRAGRYEC